jgi:hypothetical protein
VTHRSRQLRVSALARIEGEGALRVVIDNGQVRDVQLQIYEPPRFFEAFLRGRQHTEVTDITSRICGICPVAYQASAWNAIESACGAAVPEPVAALRRLLYCGEWISSHALHIYLLHAPDFLGYPDVIAMAVDHRDLVERGLRLKKAGNAILEAVGGRAIHPVNTRIGGFYRAPAAADLAPLAERLRGALDDALATVAWVAGFDLPDVELDCELLAARDPDRYAIERGQLASAGGLFLPGGRLRRARHRASGAVLHGAARDPGRPEVPHRAAGPVHDQLRAAVAGGQGGGRRGGTGPGLPQSVPQHRRPRGRGRLRDRRGPGHHRLLRAPRPVVRRGAAGRRHRARGQ